MENYFFHENYVTSEGAVSHNVLYYHQLSVAHYQVRFHANILEQLPNVYSAFKMSGFNILLDPVCFRSHKLTAHNATMSLQSMQKNQIFNHLCLHLYIDYKGVVTLFQPQVATVLRFVYFSLSSLFFPCPMSSLVPFSFSPFRIILPAFLLLCSLHFLPLPAPFTQTYHTAYPFLFPVPQRALITPYQSSSCRRASIHCSLLYVRAKLLDARAVTVTSQRNPQSQRLLHARALTVTSQTTQPPNPWVPRNWPQDTSFQQGAGTT